MGINRFLQTNFSCPASETYLEKITCGNFIKVNKNIAVVNMRIYSLLHESFEDTGYIRVWAENKGHSFTETCLFYGETLPSLEEYDLLVVMGGPMNIYEEEKYAWLSKEKESIKLAIDSGKKVIGICLGAQLIASVLGAGVTKNRDPEIGWFEVEKMDNCKNNIFCSRIPDRFHSLHWHGDTFDIPEGSVHLFKSTCCNNQGFLYENYVLGLQFHLEVTGDIVRNLVENCPDDIAQDSEYVQAAQEILDESHITPANEIMSEILDYFAEI